MTQPPHPATHLSTPLGDAPAPHWVAAPDGAAPRRSVRRRSADGTTADIVGQVLERRDDSTVLLPHDGPPVTVLDRDVVASREAPPRVVRPSSSADDLERLAATGWPGLQSTRLGGWLLRTGAGWTNRANSALAAGDPGMPTARAVDAVEAFYRDHGLTPRLQLVGPIDQDATRPPRGRNATRTHGDALRTGLLDAGWQPHDETAFLVADLRRLALDEPPGEGEPRTEREGLALTSGSLGGPVGVTPHVEGGDSRTADGPLSLRVSPRPDDDWLSIYRAGEGLSNNVVTRVLTAVDAEYLTVSDTTGPLGVARLVRTADWVGVAAVEVVPTARRRGVGRHVTVAAITRAREAGARFAYLQVGVGNEAARRLYDGLGFVLHHHYHYLHPGR